MRSTIADISSLHQKLVRQLLLSAKRPALQIRPLAIDWIECDTLSEVGGQARGRSHRRQQTVGKWAGGRSPVGESAIERRLDRRRLAKPGLNPRGLAYTHGVEEKAIASTHGGLGRELIGEAETGHEVQLVGIPIRARISTDVRIGQSAADLEI